MDSLEQDHVTHMARALRLAVVKNALVNGHITREDALEILNAPLAPDDPSLPIVDDRDKLDWTGAQFDEWMRNG